MITITDGTGFSKTTDYLKRILAGAQVRIAEQYAEEGLAKLKETTPKKTGKTANSWHYKITRRNGKITIQYYNTNVVNGSNIAILIQMGHGTKSGGYVQGRDYINPALQPTFDKLAEAAWKEMSAVEHKH